MDNVGIFVLFCIVRILLANDTVKNDYCIGDSFNPKCQRGSVILMHSALYGRMNIGKCIPIDHGSMGCQSDVLDDLDRQCSGKEACDVLVIDRNINAQGGCMAGLLRYLEAEYVCIKVLDIESSCISQQVHIDEHVIDFYLTENQLTKCNDRKIAILAKDGQTMNISQISLSDSIGNQDTYGTIKDTKSGKNKLIGHGPREESHLLTASNEVELTVSDDDDDENRFLLHIKVSGCPNMPPPEGAWMTRDGNLMEIGCHDGAKVWTLSCQDNQWVGAIGQCGAKSDNKRNEKPSSTSAEQPPAMSINVMLFGASSMIIFVSAIIFLIGVCLLKRKLHIPPQKSNMHLLMQQDEYVPNLSTMHSEQINKPNFDLSTNAKYKSLHIGQNMNNTDFAQTAMQYDDATIPPAYMNTKSDGNDTIKYYVLEDASRPQCNA